MKQEGCGQDFVARWKERFRTERLAGLYARHRGKIVSENVIRQEAKIWEYFGLTSKLVVPLHGLRPGLGIPLRLEQVLREYQSLFCCPNLFLQPGD